MKKDSWESDVGNFNTHSIKIYTFWTFNYCNSTEAERKWNILPNRWSCLAKSNANVNNTSPQPRWCHGQS